MLSKGRNARLTQVGPGTPCGQLLRRYWQALFPASELTLEKPKKRITVMSEDLVVFRAPEGGYGCVAESCAHRRCSLYYGFVEKGGIRCAYHGWKYDREGRCLEQPFEPQDSTYKDEIRQTAYPVQELAGLLFVYMGPQPAPLLPRWDVMVRKDGNRKIQIRPTLNCNWLQIQENTADTTHTYYLHGQTSVNRGLDQQSAAYYFRPIIKYDFEYCEWGIEKTCFYGGEFPEEERRPPLLFPNMLRIPEGRNENLHWRIPVDDMHTRLVVMSFRPDERRAQQESIPVEYMPSDINDEGEYSLDNFFSQDRMAWETQGPVLDRDLENLGASDRGIVMFRRLLEQQIEIVEKGGEPLALVRDPEKNKIIEFTSHSVNLLDETLRTVPAHHD
jgi:5,5'-dehydrodivanillate O-demethylase